MNMEILKAPGRADCSCRRDRKSTGMGIYFFSHGGSYMNARRTLCCERMRTGKNDGR